MGRVGIPGGFRTFPISVQVKVRRFWMPHGLESTLTSGGWRYREPDSHPYVLVSNRFDLEASSAAEAEGVVARSRRHPKHPAPNGSMRAVDTCSTTQLLLSSFIWAVGQGSLMMMRDKPEDSSSTRDPKTSVMPGFSPRPAL